MNTYIPIKTPGGTIWAEIEETPDSKGLKLTSLQDEALASFQEVAQALKQNAQFLMKAMEELAPEEIEVAFGITVGAEGGTPFFGLAKVTGEASYTVTLKWKSEEQQKK